VVARVRRERGVKSGHAGTLDPFATGLLLVLLGRATRLQRFLTELPADRIVDASHATAARDQKVRAELDVAIGELNALIRRYDLLVTPALQLPLVTLERIGSD